MNNTQTIQIRQSEHFSNPSFSCFEIRLKKEKTLAKHNPFFDWLLSSQKLLLMFSFTYENFGGCILKFGDTLCYLYLI